MDIQLTPQAEEKLSRLASESHRTVTQVVEEIVQNYAEYDDWFRREVRLGMQESAAGEVVDHDEVGRRIERVVASKTRAS